jgi:DNA repair exonuclease SbcCD ATPase subunit
MASFRFVATGDVHLSNELPHARPRRDGMTDRFEQQLEMMRMIAREAGDDPVYVIGDLYDKAKLDPITLVETVKVMQERGTWKVLPGNHDANSLTGGRFNVEIFALLGDRFELLGGDYDLSDSWQMHAVPFASIEENARQIAEIQAMLDPSRSHLLFMHNAVIGCKVDGNFRCDSHGLRAANICKGFRKVIAGHFHSHQRFGKVGMYLGAPMQHRYSDEGEERGVWEFVLADDGTLTERFIPLALPKFWTIAPGQAPPDKVRAGDYVRIEAHATNAEWAATSGDVKDTVASLEAAGLMASAKHVPAYQHDRRLEDADATFLTMTLSRLAELYVDMPDVELGSLDRETVLRVGRELAATGDQDRSEGTGGQVQFKRAQFVDLFPFGNVTVELADRGLVFVGGRNEDSDGAANNGSGKTSLYKALTWVLYGQTVDGETGDRVIRKGAREARGVVQFVSGGELWTVKRSRTAGNTKLELIAPSGESFNGKKKNLQAHINGLLTVDFQGFRSTVLYGRSDPLCFSAPGVSDADRKSILHSILQTSMFQAAHDAAKSRRDDAEEDLAVSREALAGARGRLEGADPAREDALSASWSRRRAERVAQAVAEKNATAGRLERLAGNPERVQAIKARQAEIEALQAEIKAKRDELAQDRGSLRDEARNLVPLEKTERSAAKRLAEAQGRLKASQERLAELDGDTCPTCSTPLAEGEAKMHVHALKSQTDTLRDEVDALTREARRARDEVKNFKAEIAKAETLLAQREADLPKLSSAEPAKLSKELAELESVGKVRAEIMKTIAAHEKTIAAIEAESDPHAPRVLELRTRREAIAADVARLEREVKTAQLEVGASQFWIHGFGPSGLPSIVLDSVMPRLTERTNFYLSILADGDIVGEFRTQRTLASGDTRDKIEMTWTIEGNVDVTPSDGQQTKIRVAVDLALMDLANERASVDLLLFDEVLDGLDAEGMQRMLELLCYLRGRKRSVFVISHAHGMSEQFEAGLIVVKRDKMSRIETVQ